MRVLIYLDVTLDARTNKFAKNAARRLMQMLAESRSEGETQLLDAVRVLIGTEYRFLLGEFPDLKGSILCPPKKVTAEYIGPRTAVTETPDALFAQNAIQPYRPNTCADSLAWALGSFEYDVVFCVHDNDAVRRFAQSNGIPCIVLREGYCSSYLYDSIVLDADKAVLPAFLEDPAELQPLSTLQRVLPKDLFDATVMPLGSRHARSIYRSVGRNVLIALDRQDGSNLLSTARDRSTTDLLTAVLPQLTAAGHVCYVLPPLRAKRCSISRRDHRVARRWCRSLKNVVWLTDVRTPVQCTSLINKMDVVIARYSPMGFDAILMGLPVILLGNPLWTGIENTVTVQDLEKGRLCPEQLEACRQQSLRMANFLLRWALVPKSLAFHGSFFIHRIEQLVVTVKGRGGDEGPSSQTCNLESIPSEYDLLRPYPLGSTRSTQAGQRILQRHGTLPDYHDKLDRMQRKGRKLFRDPRKFLLDSNHRSLRTIGELLAGNS